MINVTSIAARNGGGGGAVLYAGAKGFVSTVTRGWAKEVVGDDIRVNAVSPGVITTPFHDRYSTAAQLEAMQATVPMNRLGSADECAGTFLYLASDAMRGYVTGQVIEVNGGQLMPYRGQTRCGVAPARDRFRRNAAGSPVGLRRQRASPFARTVGLRGRTKKRGYTCA